MRNILKTCERHSGEISFHASYVSTVPNEEYHIMYEYRICSHCALPTEFGYAIKVELSYASYANGTIIHLDLLAKVWLLFAFSCPLGGWQHKLYGAKSYLRTNAALRCVNLVELIYWCTKNLRNVNAFPLKLLGLLIFSWDIYGFRSVKTFRADSWI